MIWTCARRVLEGTAIGTCPPRQQHTEFLTFLEKVERSTPRWREIQQILDNYGTQDRSVIYNTLVIMIRRAKFGFIL